uniref:Uncharacterized protein n=1 Tax=Arundo donax TaxID=35708 RepID=A0A0A9A0K7_ARUDO
MSLKYLPLKSPNRRPPQWIKPLLA